MRFSYIVILLLFASCKQGNNHSPEKDPIKTDSTQVAPTSDKTVKFLWRDSSAAMLMNQDFCKKITDSEKAALGYVATFMGNECKWDGSPTKDRTNLKCEILTALNLGYQCSEQHLGFLQQWFKNDTTVLKELEACLTTPNTSTIQDTFDEIVLTTKGNEISVFFKANGINLREEREWSWSETNYFKVQNERIQLVRKEKSKVKVRHFNANVK